MAWFLNPALTRFRAEVNGLWPNRDKKSDGTIGDLAHQGTNSDHNPDPDGSVDAWDMDVDGVDVQKVIAAALRHESIQYVIYNRRITSRTWGLGTWRPYDGASPHTEHVHFNTRPSHENSTKPWFTEEDALSVETDGLKAILTGSGSGTLGAANQLHIKLNDILKAAQATQKAAEAAAGRSLGILSMTDVITAWSTQTPKGVDANKLAPKVNAILAAVLNVDEEVIAKLGAEATPEEQAALLRAVLGERAKAVGQILANG